MVVEMDEDLVDRHTKGLLFNVGQLVAGSDQDAAAFLDLELQCSDGVVRWNKFLLAATSSLLYQALRSGSIYDLKRLWLIFLKNVC
jgi:hypothetical protein